MELFKLGIVNLELKIYHTEHPDLPTCSMPVVNINSFAGCLPTLPTVCNECEEEIKNQNELGYELEFYLVDGKEFRFSVSLDDRLIVDDYSHLLITPDKKDIF